MLAAGGSYRPNRVLTSSLSSSVGYIVGLGDRHIQNILIDEQTAELVHIDLGGSRVLPRRDAGTHADTLSRPHFQVWRLSRGRPSPPPRPSPSGCPETSWTAWASPEWRASSGGEGRGGVPNGKFRLRSGCGSHVSAPVCVPLCPDVARRRWR